jgi:ubiquitin-conjugating enzyme E2 variant
VEAPDRIDPNDYGPAKGVFHLGCLVSVFVLAGWLGRPLLDRAAAGELGWIALGAVLGLLAADLMSGVAHWIFDTYGDESTPIIGVLFIKLFRVHHEDPLNITYAGFVRINGDNSMLAAGFLLVVGGLGALGVGPTGPVALTAVIAFAIGIAFTNLLHQWSHRTELPAIARVLHRCRLVLTPAAHARHHTPPFRSDYCITFGWLNPVLERLRFFRRLEAIIGFLAQPRRRSSATAPAPRAAMNRNTTQ